MENLYKRTNIKTGETDTVTAKIVERELERYEYSQWDEASRAELGDASDMSTVFDIQAFLNEAEAGATFETDLYTFEVIKQ